VRKQPKQFLLEFVERNFAHRFARVDEQIPANGKVDPIQPEDFAHTPPQSVASNRRSQAYWRGDSDP
jgi:hypothetical protein